MCFRAPQLITIATLLLVLATTGGAAELVGRVVDTGGSPIPGATVVARSGAAITRTVTGSDGRFRLQLPETLPPWILDVVAEGYQDAGTTTASPGIPVEVVLTPSPRFAGEVEVTAVRADVAETPVTVSNLTRDEIGRSYWGQDVPVLLADVPSFTAYSDSGNGIGYSYFSLRGFDMRRTAVSLNGVPLNDAHSHSVFFVDLSDFLATTGSIQVQRGVGTTLYGGSAIGGSVDLETRAPLPERRLRVSLAGGSWGTRRIAGELDTGLLDGGWAATFRWSRIETDGYRDQSWVEMWNYYGAIERSGEHTSTRIVLFGGPERTHLAFEGVPRRYLEGEVTGNRRRDRRFNPLEYTGEIDEFFQPHWQLHHSWRLRDDLTVDNTVFYFEGDGFFEQLKRDRWLPEYALPPYPGPDGDPIETTDLIRRRHVDEWDAGWIPHLEWRHEGGTLQAGLMLRLHSGRHWGETVWAQHYPPGLQPNQRYYDYRLDKRTLQPFLQETWRPHDRLTVLAGVTFSSHRYDMSEDRRKGVEVEQRFDLLLPRLGVTWRATPAWNLYANLSRGGREPAFRDLYDPQDYWFGDPLDLDPEELTDLELGARHDWRTGWARFNLYWLDFSNAIVWAGGLDNNGVPVTANGAVVTQKGAELELAWNPRPRWGGRVALAWTDATFDRFEEFDFDGGSVDHAGNRVAGVPEWLGTVQLAGGWGPLDGTLTVRHSGRFYLDNTEDLRKQPEGRLDPGFVHRVNGAFTTAELGLRADLGSRLAGALGARAVALDLRVVNLFDSLYTSFGYFDGVEPVWIPAATRTAVVGLTFDW